MARAMASGESFPGPGVYVGQLTGLCFFDMGSESLLPCWVYALWVDGICFSTRGRTHQTDPLGSLPVVYKSSGR